MARIKAGSRNSRASPLCAATKKEIMAAMMRMMIITSLNCAKKRFRSEGFLASRSTFVFGARLIQLRFVQPLLRVRTEVIEYIVKRLCIEVHGILLYCLESVAKITALMVCRRFSPC